MVAVILKECYVVTTLSFFCVALGFVLAYPAVLTPGITGNSTDIHCTKDEAAWIAASYSITGVLSFFTLPPLMQTYGRKKTSQIMNMIVLTGSIIIALTPDFHTLMAGRALQGMAFCGLYINSIITAEYCHPRRRGFFMTLKAIGVCFGVIMCHGLSVVLTWREIAWLAAVPAALGVLNVIVIPESPTWLAYKGRFEECTLAFEWLRGKGRSRGELAEIISTEQEISNKERSSLLRTTVNTYLSKEFLKPLAIMTLIVTLSQVFGLYYLDAYIIQIILQLTGSKFTSYYYTLALDFLNMFAILLSSFMISFSHRRTLLFLSGTFSCVLLSFVCIFAYLEFNGILYLKWLTPSLLVIHSFVFNSGIIPVYVVLAGEIFPMKFKSVGTSFVGIVYSLWGFLTLKFTPKMLGDIEVHGTFAVYLGIGFGCLICLYFILPETKDITLQGIEKKFMHHQKVGEDDKTNDRDKNTQLLLSK